MEKIEAIVLTGNKVMDCLQAAIKFHQDNKIDLCSITLTPEWYDKFWEYMDKANFKHTGSNLKTDNLLCLYDVDIKLGESSQKSKMYYEYCENKTK